MKFYEYDQNNSGGNFVFDGDRGSTKATRRSGQSEPESLSCTQRHQRPKA